ERLGGNCSAVPIGDGRRKANAMIDFSDLRRSDAILVIVPEVGGTGMWFEFGAAYEMARHQRMRILLVGPAMRRTIFAELPGCEIFETDSQAIAALESYPTEPQTEEATMGASGERPQS